MVFSSMVFLCVFLPAVFGLHWILPGIRAKNALLIIASLLFYAYGEPVYVLLLIVSALFNYACAGAVSAWPKGKKLVLALTIAGNLGVLIFYKYAGFLTESWNLMSGMSVPVPEVRMPIGISFFTFQAMSYVVDVYRKVTDCQKSFWKVLLYISFFPQLIAGPIVKYHDVEQEIHKRTQTLDGVTKGIRRFAAGLSKKVLLANTLGLTADVLFAAKESEVNWLLAWIANLSYVFQIYFDFSGYSDMAIGMGWMFGFHFKENFNYPYISGSIKEFWRRWHMSLSGWFREYLYIPLGGNRKGKFRTVVNKMIVFLCTGIWHGASWNFVFWGVYHGCFLLLEEYIPVIGRKGNKAKSCLQRIYTMLVVGVGFVFFRTETMGKGFFWLKMMFTGFGKNRAAMSLVWQQLTPLYIVTLLAAVIASMPVKELVRKKRGYEPASYLLSFAGLILCMFYLAGGTYNPFIYFRF